MATATCSNKRDRHGSARATKKLSWHVITQLQRDFDTTTDADERLKIGRLLVNAFSTHSKLCETVDLDTRIRQLEKGVGD